MLTVAEGGVLGAVVVEAHPPMRNAAKQARAGLMGNFIRRRINFVFMVLVPSWLFVVSCLFVSYSLTSLLRCCAGLLRPALQMMNRLAVDRSRFGTLEFLDVFGRQLRPV